MHYSVATAAPGGHFAAVASRRKGRYVPAAAAGRGQKTVQFETLAGNRRGVRQGKPR
jgi:hypothetical protein